MDSPALQRAKTVGGGYSDSPLPLDSLIGCPTRSVEISTDVTLPRPAARIRRLGRLGGVRTGRCRPRRRLGQPTGGPRRRGIDRSDDHGHSHFSGSGVGRTSSKRSSDRRCKVGVDGAGPGLDAAGPGGQPGRSVNNVAVAIGIPRSSVQYRANRRTRLSAGDGGWMTSRSTLSPIRAGRCRATPSPERLD